MSGHNKSRPADMPVQFQNIPEFMKECPNWILWKWTPNKTRTSWTKPPLRADGRPASVDDPRTWTTFDEAFQAYQFGDFSGVGWVLPEGIVGVDLDDCIKDGKPSHEARAIVAAIPSYSEISPSGKGLKILIAGKVDRKRAITSPAKGIEIYEGTKSNRYFTVTGNLFDPRFPNIRPDREGGLDLLQELISAPIPSNFLDPDAAPDQDTVARVKEAVGFLGEDFRGYYDPWLHTGMALHATDPGEDMFVAWVEWSKASPAFDSVEACRVKWESFSRDRARLFTADWVFAKAKANGWRPERYQTLAVSADQFLAKDIVRDYIVEDFLVRGEPGIVGGASKSLKTSVSLDLAVSIASGTKFLGVFPVPVARRTMIISGESGETTIQETLRDIAASRGLPATALKDLLVGFHLAKLDSADQMDDLIADLKDRGVEVLIIDPLYRSLRVGDGASNVYTMGDKFDQIAEKLNRTGITVLLNHHFKKQGKTYGECPDLEDLSQSGVSEFARQFLLLKRREAYEHDGNHLLWFVWGGSAGHQGRGIAKIITGTRKTGTKWETEFLTEKKYEEIVSQRREIQAEESLEMRKEKVLEIISEHEGIGSGSLRERFQGNSYALKAVLNALQGEGKIEIRDVKSAAGTRPKKGHFLAENA